MKKQKKKKKQIIKINKKMAKSQLVLLWLKRKSKK